MGETERRSTKLYSFIQELDFHNQLNRYDYHGIGNFFPRQHYQIWISQLPRRHLPEYLRTGYRSVHRRSLLKILTPIDGPTPRTFLILHFGCHRCSPSHQKRFDIWNYAADIGEFCLLEPCFLGFVQNIPPLYVTECMHDLHCNCKDFHYSCTTDSHVTFR